MQTLEDQNQNIKFYTTLNWNQCRDFNMGWYEWISFFVWPFW